MKQKLGAAEGLKCEPYIVDRSWDDYEKLKVEAENKRVGTLSDYNCDKCMNRGYTAKLNEYNRMILVPCGCKKTRASIKAAKQSGAWELMQRCNFENFIAKNEWQKTIKQIVMSYTKQKGWLFAGGQTGAGKTHLCVAAFKYFFREPVNGIYMRWRNEMRKMLNAGFSGADETEARMRDLRSCDVLYIDDLFKTDDTTKPERREIEMAFEIINERGDRKLPTIISSERTIADIASFNQAIAGRIKENCGKYVIEIEPDVQKNYRLVSE